MSRSVDSRTHVVVIGHLQPAAFLAMDLRVHGFWTWTVTNSAELQWVLSEAPVRPHIAVVRLSEHGDVAHVAGLATKVASEGIPTIVLGNLPPDLHWLEAVATVLPSHALLADLTAAIVRSLQRQPNDGEIMPADGATPGFRRDVKAD